jgi:hypothetical protein
MNSWPIQATQRLMDGIFKDFHNVAPLSGQLHCRSEHKQSPCRDDILVESRQGRHIGRK